MGVGERKRRVRSDKKREVQPTLPLDLKETIYRISYITNTPVKDVAESICLDGMKSRKVLDVLSGYFRRSVTVGSTMYIGDLSRPSLQRQRTEGLHERISVRFQQADFEDITTLAYGLGVTPTRATALLLDTSIRNSDFVNSYFENYLRDQLDERRMNELKKVLQYLNENNPFDEEISWGMLLSYLASEIKEGATTMKETISLYIKKWK